jgi:proline iminopeptidase
VRAFCDALGIARPVVVGQSFGGMVAMAYASRHPGHASKLVLSSTAARMRLDVTLSMMERTGGARARTIAERFWADPTPEVANEYLTTCLPLYNPRPAPEFAAAGRRAILRFDVLLTFIRGEQRTMDLRGDLAKVRTPTLVLAGRQDPITPLACAEEILAALPRDVAQMEVFPDAGHGVFRDEPVRAEASLRRFFAA